MMFPDGYDVCDVATAEPEPAAEPTASEPEPEAKPTATLIDTDDDDEICE